ncbi:MAG: ferritin family protein [Desulfobacterales bacterium]|nr:ferritin family protein [Desulfobacterales bacterium]MDX2513068.1 ferritin family protein [Desulfobacterales bacterium]
MFTSKEILDIALKIEQNGEAVYRRATQELANPDLAKKLTWMADEEARHAEWFMNLQSDLRTHTNRNVIDDMNSGMLGDLIGEQSFTLQDIDFPGVKGLKNLIDIFIEFEKDGILFYELLRTFIKDQDVLESLDQIIAEEYRHIEILQEIKS